MALIFGLVGAASGEVAGDGEGTSGRESTSGPAAQPQAVLAELGTWQIFARRLTRQGSVLRFEDVQASRPANSSRASKQRASKQQAPRQGEPARWHLAAARVDIGLSPAGLGQLDWLRAQGTVRLSGPDDLYVMADELVSIEPDRRLVLLAGNEPAASMVGGQQLVAERISVDLWTASQRLEELSPPTGQQRLERGDAEESGNAERNGSGLLN